MPTLYLLNMFFINGGIWGCNHSRSVTTILLAAYHVISWGDLKKCLFASDVTSETDHRTKSIHVQLSEPEELLELLTRGLGDSKVVASLKSPLKHGQQLAG